MPGTISMVDQPEDGDIITADAWIAEFLNIINNGLTPDGVDDASTDASTMAATTDPYPASSESLATSLRGEIYRQRYQWVELLKRFGKTRAATQWYVDIPYAFGIKGTDISSSTAITIPNDGNYYHVTGTTNIASIAALGIGSRVTLVFDDVLNMVHSTDLILPGSEDITTVAGDVFDFVEYAAGDWRCVASSRGAKTTKWTTFTPTGSWVSNVTYAGKYRRVGDTMELDISLSLTGAPTSTGLTVTLPLSLLIDTAKMANPGSEAPVGFGITTDSDTGHVVPVTVRYNSTSTVSVIYANIAGGASYLELNTVTQAAPFTYATGDKVNFRFSVPISGWTAY